MIEYIKRIVMSRKFRWTIAGVIGVWASRWIPGVTQEQVFACVSLVVALVLGIAIEDAGEKANPNNTENKP